MEAVATIATLNGSKYLQQLCKHWGHKFGVEFDAAAGKIAFPTSAVVFAAMPKALTMTLLGPDADTLERMKRVVADHLQRFAFRETLAVEWLRA